MVEISTNMFTTFRLSFFPPLYDTAIAAENKHRYSEIFTIKDSDLSAQKKIKIVSFI